jgi:hypothetical protein
VLAGTLLTPSLELGPIQEVILDSQDAYFYNLKILAIPGARPLDDFVTAAPGVSTPIDVLDYATGAAPTVGLQAPLALVAPIGQPSLPGGQTVVSGSNPSDIVYTNTLSAQPGQHPIDSFTYTVRDANGKTATGTVYITIDTPPVVRVTVSRPASKNGSVWEIPHGTPGPLTGLINVFDAEGDPVTLAVYAQPSPGTLTLTKVSDYQYSFSYVPPTTYAYDDYTGVSTEVQAIVGSDQFTLRASDLVAGGGALSSVDDTVVFRVPDNPPQTASVEPSATPAVSEFVVPENVGVSYYKLGYEQPGYYVRGLDYPGLVHFAAPGVLWNQVDIVGIGGDEGYELDPLRAELATPPRHGLLYLLPDGSFNYTPRPGFTGTDTFQFYASDGYLAGPATSVIIHVVPGTARQPYENAPVLHDIHYALAAGTSSPIEFTPPVFYYSLYALHQSRSSLNPLSKRLIEPVDFVDAREPRIMPVNLTLDRYLGNYQQRHQSGAPFRDDLSLFYQREGDYSGEHHLLALDNTDATPGQACTDCPIALEIERIESAGGAPVDVSMTYATSNARGWLSNFAAVKVRVYQPLAGDAQRAELSRGARAEITPERSMRRRSIAAGSASAGVAPAAGSGRRRHRTVFSAGRSTLVPWWS